MMERVTLYLDSDNAMGSLHGDIDDGFALAVLLKSSVPVEALGSIFGNTSERLAHANSLRLAELCAFRGQVLAGASAPGSVSSASDFLSWGEGSLRIVALGPLTNVASALRTNPHFWKRVQDLVCVGTNLYFRPPAWRFFDFNQSCDPVAFRDVFESHLPLTLVPCDIARRLRLSERELENLCGRIGEYFREHSKRWFTRARWMKGPGTVPLWDVVAAMFAIEPSLFETKTFCARLSPRGSLKISPSAKRILRCVTGFDPAAVWRHFVEIVNRVDRVCPQNQSHAAIGTLNRPWQ